MPLSSFEAVRSRVHRLLGDVEQEMRSDLTPGTGPTRAQAAHWRKTRAHIAAAKEELDMAADLG